MNLGIFYYFCIVLMDAAYHQKRYHFVQSLWGMLIGLIPCLIGAGIYACIV